MRVILLGVFLISSLFVNAQNLPKGFVYALDYIPNLKHELRYCNDNNFVGEPIEGYERRVIIMTLKAVKQLKKVQDELNSNGYSLIIYDAYRPQEAVSHFVRWAKQINDTVMKQEFYPKVNKRLLFKQGYISSKSRHSSGSTADLSIVNLKSGKVLDMGSPFDYFGTISHVSFSDLTSIQKKNRQLLQQVMKKHGFRSYPKEWWHFTLVNEPFRNQYFNFKVK